MSAFRRLTQRVTSTINVSRVAHFARSLHCNDLVRCQADGAIFILMIGSNFLVRTSAKKLAKGRPQAGKPGAGAIPPPQRARAVGQSVLLSALVSRATLSLRWQGRRPNDRASSSAGFKAPPKGRPNKFPRFIEDRFLQPSVWADYRLV